MASADTYSLSSLQEEKSLEWWYIAPVVLAVVMFLLVGTLFERRIEAKIRSFLERRFSQAPQAEQTAGSTVNVVSVPNNLGTASSHASPTAPAHPTAPSAPQNTDVPNLSSKSKSATLLRPKHIPPEVRSA